MVSDRLASDRHEIKARHGQSRLQVEHRVKAAVNAPQRGHSPDGDQRSVDVRTGARAGIMPDAESLIGHAEDHLGANHVTGKPDRVHLDA